MMIPHTVGWLVIYVFASIWLLGWIATIRSTSVSQERALRQIGGIALLFLVWPYIALCMANQGDI